MTYSLEVGYKKRFYGGQFGTYSTLKGVLKQARELNRLGDGWHWRPIHLNK